MKPALKVVSTVSLDRQVLAQALAEAAPANAAVDKARNAAEAARGALASAVGAVPAAERAAEAAKANIIENPHASRAELRALRQAVADAVDDCEIAREVAARAEAVLVSAERSARSAMERIEALADAVIAANFGPAIAAAERAGKEYARLAFAAGAIAASGHQWNGERTLLTGRAQTLNAHVVFRGDGGAIAAARQEAGAPWHAARAALLVDADAPLPEVG